MSRSSFSVLEPVRLGAVASVSAGLGVSRHDDDARLGVLLPVIGVRDLDSGVVAPAAELDAVSFPDLERAQNHAVRCNDVLLTGRGTVLKFALVGPETAGAVASANIIIVRPNNGVEGGTLFAILSSEVYRPQIELLRRGATTLLSLSPKDLAKLELNLPPLEEQQRISEFIRESQRAYRAAIEAADLRQALARALINERLFGHN
jgi:restriction endonuclease S subunit